MKATHQKVVVLDYTLTDDEGSIIDESQGGDFVYLHGYQNIIPGLEQAMEGKQAGDEFDVTISPADGYGEFDEGKIQVVPKAAFPDDTELQPGMQFHAQSPEGQVIEATVTQIEEANVTIDANHALAGKTLHFKIKVIDIRDASAEELEHGHVHGPGGHHH